jgi:hypothetical protein
LRKKFVSEAVKNGVEGYKALRQAADLYEAANFAKDAAILN